MTSDPHTVPPVAPPLRTTSPTNPTPTALHPPRRRAALDPPAARPPAAAVPAVLAPRLPGRLGLRTDALRRNTDAVQFGVDPEQALVVDGLTPPLRRMISSLDGTRCAAEVVADAVARGVAPGPARTTLSRMDAVGLLREARARRPREPASVLVRGAGRLAALLADLLADAGVDAARSSTTQAGPRRTCRSDLVVLADDPAPGPAVLNDLMATRQPHLAVAVHDDVGFVGPLVLPGRGACVRCAELARADADPEWPRLRAQLPRPGGPGRQPPVAVVAATAALALAQVRAVLDAPANSGDTAGVGHTADAQDSGPGTDGGPAGPAAGRPPALGAILRIDPRSGSLRRSAVSPHPACPCALSSPFPVTPPTACSRPDPSSRLVPVSVGRVA